MSGSMGARIGSRIRWVVVPLAAALVAACGSSADEAAGTVGSSSADIEELAKEEGQLVWYSGSDPGAAEQIVKAFTEKYGIEVENVRLSSGPLVQRFKSEVSAGAPSADVILTVDKAFFDEADKEGWITPLKTEEVVLPEIAEWSDDEMANPSAMIVAYNVFVGSYNTKVVGDFEPKTWKDLLDPRLKDKLIVSDPRNSTAWASFFNMVLHDPELGESYLEGIGAQNPRVTDTLTGVQLLGAGEGGALIGSPQVSLAPLLDKGAPIKSFVFQDPAIRSPHFQAAVTDAQHPNAARLFIAFMASEEGQQIYNAAHKTASPLGPLEGALEMPSGTVDPPVDQVKAELPKILDLLGIT
ncbi:extracellular solute-binding protein [Actinophytocola sp.]|uniref:ABC transporter substrate-binding protein n=1 Tax=Actinophytocola sp. TaxID=1872138 RepID=UPI003D6B915B